MCVLSGHPARNTAKDQDFRNAMKLPRRQFLHLVAGAAALPAVSHFARAQGYPTRPIRLVVPFPPGGGYDLIARPWADKMKSLLGTIVVENMGGGGSSLGAAAVARASPDGYTLLVGGTIPHVNEAVLKGRPLYDPIKDLHPISCIAVAFFAIAINPSLPAQTLRVRLKTSSRMADLSQHEADGGELQEGEPAAVEIFPVLGETTATTIQRLGNCTNPFA